MKQKILIVVFPERLDFYNYLEKLNQFDLYILWYVKRKDKLGDLPNFIKGQYFWSDYLTPFSLINTIKPDKIVFFEIIDLRQIALIVAARSKNIRTFYLEHGASGDRETAIKRWNEKSHLEKKRPYIFKRLFKEVADVLSSKFFYYSVIKGFLSKESYFKYCALPFRMLGGLPNKVLSHNTFKERVPDYAIVHNQANFEEFELYTQVSQDKVVKCGIPFFDKFYKENLVEENYIVYIDTPFFEEKLLDWSKEHHHKIAKSLFEFADSNRVKTYIKLHPKSNLLLWESYGFDSPYFKIIQFGDFAELYLKSALILGYSSSLITGFLCAKKNIVILAWHPTPSIFGADFSQTGLCHISSFSEDLEVNYSKWLQNNLAVQNNEKYLAFLKRFNYPFDGYATDRVIQFISNN